MKNRIKKLVAVMLCVSILGCFGCGKSDGSKESAKGVKMYLTVSSADTFRELLINEVKKTAESMGAEIVVSEADDSLEKQIDQIEEAVKGKYDVILCNPVDVDTALQLQVVAGDIPIVFFNASPNDSRLEPDKYVFAGSAEGEAGKFQAEYILDKCSSKDTINVAVFEGQKGHSGTIGRTTSLKSELKKSGKTINYVFDDNANWSQDEACQQFSLFLKTGQNVDVVACNNDSMALGVIQACEENNVDPASILIVGVDATAEGCKAIEEGKMQFTAYQSAIGQGTYAAKAAARLAQGKSLDGLKYLSDDKKKVFVPFEKVDKSNVKEYE